MEFSDSRRSANVAHGATRILSKENKLCAITHAHVTRACAAPLTDGNEEFGHKNEVSIFFMLVRENTAIRAERNVRCNSIHLHGLAVSERVSWSM